MSLNFYETHACHVRNVQVTMQHTLNIVWDNIKSAHRTHMIRRSYSLHTYTFSNQSPTVNKYLDSNNYDFKLELEQ